MSESLAAPASAPRPKKARAAGGARKPKAAPTHPPVAEMVVAAINSLKERGGSSAQAIKKYIASNYKADVERLAPFIKKYLKSAVVNGVLAQTKGKGANGSFKVKQAAAKPKAAKKAKRPAGAKKPRAPKKAANPSGSAAPKQKKAKTPKKKTAAAKPKAAKPKAAKVEKKAKKPSTKAPKKVKTPKPKAPAKAKTPKKAPAAKQSPKKA